ncbi:MAG: hypothetical protein KC983_06865, partial [Phycisphaerales bacterium]|nr:hypothetical protein [Phycisphaerales bacterium]
NLLAAMKTQPFGALLAVMTAAACLVGAFVAVTGSRLGSLFARLWRKSVIWSMVALLFLAWGYKILDHRSNRDRYDAGALPVVTSGLPGEPF